MSAALGGSATALRAAIRRWPAIPALLAGLVAATALPPFHLLPALLGFGCWLWLLRQAKDRWHIARIGLAFGYGWHLVSLYWVATAFYTDVERFGALAVPSVLLLALANALFAMSAAWLAAIRPWRSTIAHAAMLAVTWSLLEYFRGQLGTRFPWNPLAIVWMPVPEILQTAAFVGSRGLSALTLLAALLWATLFSARDLVRWHGPVLSLVLIAGSWVFGWARLETVLPVREPAIELRIVQGNIEQHHKWDPDKRRLWFERYLELSTTTRAVPARLVIWPESAVPYQLEREPLVREAVASVVPAGGYVLTGGNRFELEADPPVANNSLFIVDPTGEIRDRYDKVDLVPFGEFLPARPVLATIGLRKLTEGSIDFVAGPGRRTMALDGIPSFSPLICYEAIFPGDAISTEERPGWLLNVTNDAWFGRSSGPYQHLAMARLRAIEEGLPLVRAANTGISAVVDALGRDVARLELGQTGIIDTQLPPSSDQPTLFRRLTPYGEIFLLMVVSLAGIFAEMRDMRSR